MDELERVLIDDSAAAPPATILAKVSEHLAHRHIAGPRTIYEELWHIVFWQQMTLDWISGRETAYPKDPSVSFPTLEQIGHETWEALRQRFFATLELAVAPIHDGSRLKVVVRCPSPPGAPVREMTVREQLESLAAHNTYHLGRIVLLIQIAGEWEAPPKGLSW